MSELEKQCLSLPIEEKERLINALVKSLDVSVTGKTLEEIHEAVVKVLGCEIITKSRRRREYIGRIIFSYVGFLEGYSEPCMGKYLNRNHSSVHLMKCMMKDWLQMPRLYKDEIEKYEQVRKELNYETDR